MKRRRFISMGLLTSLLAGCKSIRQTIGGSLGPINTHDGDGSEAHPFTEKLAHGPLDRIWSNILWARQQVADELVARFPGYSGCGRCKLPWSIIDGHMTEEASGQGTFPLCEQCWKELATAENRLPYYRALVDSWKRWSSDAEVEKRWTSIESAVREEDKSGGWYMTPVPQADPAIVLPKA